MDSSDIVKFITCLDNVSIVEADGNYFFSCAQDKAAQSAHWMPFATLITNDAYDQDSDLNRSGVYRLNIGVSRATFQQHFPSPTDSSASQASGSPSIDYAALDRIMPHPIYADQHWVSVLTPRPATFETVKPLLAESHARAIARQRAREQHQRE